MKILFIGTVKSSKILLEKLISMNENIVGVLTKKESKFNADFYDIAQVCKRNNIDYKYIDNINEKESLEYIKQKDTDVIYCFGLSQIIGKEIIEIPNKGVIGFHPAHLPKNRGRHPVIWALALGLKETASTFFFINEGMDTGDILSQETIKIDYTDDANSLYEKIMDIAKDQVEVFTKQLKENAYYRIKQNHKETNYWRKRNKWDGVIDWRMSSRSIYNLVRALTKPYVGAHFVHNKRDIKVWKVEEVEQIGFENIEPGKVLKVYSKNSFLIKASDHLIKVLDCEDVLLKEGDYL
ncbi:formyltransferase family protein [Marinisporobacter balticus]|uniref:Methionyl-tRNA formyltransferase n=1 Tax=Marinisporobacter balticus TaxID=2018667 RepID=A0A4R2KTZ3_9FIRM|nr:formyltransferase family protein [Marinisporobacter balticus]TCO73648.1 methionyl-tRNA formyltransferase [Marinisporobacter balticus]